MSVLLAAAVPLVRAGAFDVPIDLNESSLAVELRVESILGGSHDSDSSAVTGTVTIALDSVDSPSQVWLHDFDSTLADPLSLTLMFGFFGRFDATMTGVGPLYADPNIVLGPETIEAQAFLFPNVWTALRGLTEYSATGLVCTMLGSAGWTCDDTFDLSSLPPRATVLSGSIATVDRVVTLTMEVDQTWVLFDTENGVATIRVFGTVTGSVLVPRPPGDVDGDGDVDVRDAQLWMECCNGPDVLTPPPACEAYHFEGSDLDGDGDVDLADAAALALLVGD